VSNVIVSPGPFWASATEAIQVVNAMVLMVASSTTPVRVTPIVMYSVPTGGVSLDEGAATVTVAEEEADPPLLVLVNATANVLVA